MGVCVQKKKHTQREGKSRDPHSHNVAGCKRARDGIDSCMQDLKARIRISKSDNKRINVYVQYKRPVL